MIDLVVNAVKSFPRIETKVNLDVQGITDKFLKVGYFEFCVNII